MATKQKILYCMKREVDSKKSLVTGLPEDGEDKERRILERRHKEVYEETVLVLKLTACLPGLVWSGENIYRRRNSF